MPELTLEMREWLASLYRKGYDNHMESSRNYHIWALGAETNEASTAFEKYADEHRKFANTLEEMAREIEESE